MPFGVFLKTASGITGLIPNAEMGTPPGTDHKRMFPTGTEMQAVVLEADSANKIRLSRKAVLEKAAQDEFAQYQESVKTSPESSGGLGSLGDMLKAKLKRREQRELTRCRTQNASAMLFVTADTLRAVLREVSYLHAPS